MPYYRQVGDSPARSVTPTCPCRRRPAFEELMGHEGFAQESSLLYHRGSPSRDRGGRCACTVHRAVTLDLPVLPRHLRTDAVLVTGTDAVRGPHVLLANEDVRIAWFVATTDSELYRDATGDQLVYVQSGRGCSSRASARSRSGRATTCVIPRDDPPLARRHPMSRSPRSCSRRPATSRVPRKYLTDRGQFREGSAVLRARSPRSRRARSSCDGPTCRCSCAPAPG